jgi:exonuclease 3'-5' domain-containing protein 1
MDDLTKATAAISLTSSTKLSTPSSVDGVCIVSDGDDLTEVIEHIKGCDLLAIDCEGVDLGRDPGVLCLVQLATPQKSFLFDVHEISREADMVTFLREVLEDKSVIKIIHDCRMDADALFHHLDIRLFNVHDTQAWDSVIHGSENNLNKTLLQNGCTPNMERDHSVYDRNIAFWSTRPLTAQMVEWAAGDIANLFQLHEVQVVETTHRSGLKEKCEAKSQANAAYLPDKMMRFEYISGGKIGKFIGRGVYSVQHQLQSLCSVVYGGRCMNACVTKLILISSTRV